MQCPVRYDLNRHLAREARAEARDERLEQIAANIRAITLESLAVGNEEYADDVWCFVDEGAIKKLMCDMAAGNNSNLQETLASVFSAALDDHVMYEAERELKRLEAIEAEDAALAGVSMAECF